MCTVAPHQSDREQQTAEAYENISFAFSAGPAPPRAIMSGWVAYMGAGGHQALPLHAERENASIQLQLCYTVHGSSDEGISTLELVHFFVF